MEVKRTVPVKLDVPDERRDDLHATIAQFNGVIRIAYAILMGSQDARVL